MKFIGYLGWLLGIIGSIGFLFAENRILFIALGFNGLFYIMLEENTRLRQELKSFGVK